MFGKIKGMLGGERSERKAESNPAELGKVAFGRDLEVAFAASESSGKPIFLLFQEIPGCSTCTTFGRQVLSSGKVMAAIESDFIAVAINNRALLGHDKKALKRFDEPMLNNPVVRFLNSKGEDVIAREDGVYGEREMLKRMAGTLEALSRPLPESLQNIGHMRFL